MSEDELTHKDHLKTIENQSHLFKFQPTQPLPSGFGMFPNMFPNMF